MEKNRVAGAAKTGAGKAKEAASKMLGDQKMTAEGKAKKMEGKIQNAHGGAKDAVREMKKQ